MRQDRAIDITANLVAKILIGVLSLLLCLHLVAITLHHGFGYEHAKGYVPLTHLDMESNIPTMVSFKIMILCAMASIVMAWKASRQRYHKQVWILIAMMFVFLSADETMMLHETFAQPLGLNAVGEDTLKFAWIVPYAIGVGIIGIFLLPWFFGLPRNLQISFVIAGGMFIIGALGMEFVASKYVEALPEETWTVRRLSYDLLATFEEMLELSGISFFLYTLVKEIGGFRFRLLQPANA